MLISSSEKNEKGINLDDFIFLEIVEKYARADQGHTDDLRRYLSNLFLVFKDYHREVEEHRFE